MTGPLPAVTIGRVSPTILIADDDGVSRKLLRRLLERDGHEVRSAANGADALELFAQEAIDIVLLDIVMPELDGISVLERLKATPAASHVPVIMISAVDGTESVVRCIEIGADDYLAKPFNPVILRARINAGLTKKRLHDLERAQVHDVFCRFLPEHVVDDVLARADTTSASAACAPSARSCSPTCAGSPRSPRTARPSS